MRLLVANALEDHRWLFDIAIALVILALIPFVVVSLLILVLVECGRSVLAWLEDLR